MLRGICALLLVPKASAQCPMFGKRNYYDEHCEVLTYNASTGFAYAWLNAGKTCRDTYVASSDADIYAVWPEGADPKYKRNGPRVWMTACVGFDDTDALAARAAQPFRSVPPRFLGDDQYAIQAQLPFESVDKFEGWGDGGMTYEGALVDRNVVMAWDQGQTVYELVDAAGGRYVMQSMSQIVVPDLQASDLEALPRDLPLGLCASGRRRVRRLRAPSFCPLEHP